MTLLWNRWIIVPGALALLVLGWNLYVATHDGGTITGLVVDAAGDPVPGATVVLYARTFLTNDPRQSTQTGPDGRFHFTGNDNHALQLQASSPDGATSPRRTVRLLFRAEDITMSSPLQLAR